MLRLVMDRYFKTRIETISEVDFWSAIRPNRALRDAVSAGQAGRRDDAYRHFGAYHAHSLASEAEAFKQSLDDIGDPAPVRREADRVLRHEVQGWHTHVRQFGPVIDFNADFGQSGQYGFHYLAWLQPVLKSYILSGRPAYRDCLIEIIRQYYDQRTAIVRRIPSLHPVYYELGAWAKTNLLLPAYAVLTGEDALETDAREAMLKLLLGFARSLYRLQQGGYRAGNWQIVGCQSLYAIGAAFPEFREAPRWRRRAEAILEIHAKKDFFPDGGHGERCWGYGIMSLEGMAQFYYSAVRHNRMDPRRRARWRRFLKQGYRWFAAASAPGRMMLNYGDGAIRSAADIIARAERLFPELKRASGDLGLDLAKSNILRPSGYAFMRCGDTPDAPFMSINFGRWGGGHTHDDLLDFTLWRYGQPLIEEVGRFDSYDHPFGPRFRAAESHNQIVLDHVPMNRPAHEAHEVHWSCTEAVDMFSAWHEAYGRGARIQRQVVFLKPDAWLIFDAVTAREYIFQATSCLHAVRPFQPVRPGVWTLCGQPGCQVVFADPETLRRTATGTDYDATDYAALASSTPAYLHERHRLQVSRWRDVGDARPITFAMLLVPFNGRPPTATLRSLPISGDPTGQAAAFSVELDGRRHDVIFNPARARVRACRHASDALMTAHVGRDWIV